MQVFFVSLINTFLGFGKASKLPFLSPRVGMRSNHRRGVARTFRLSVVPVREPSDAGPWGLEKEQNTIMMRLDSRLPGGAKLGRQARAVVTIITGLAIAVIGGLAMAAPAQAADYQVGEWGTYNGGTTWWGPMIVGGTNTLCIDPVIDPPASLNAADATKVCGTDTNGQPDQTEQLAYLLAKYLDTTDTQTAVSLSEFGRTQYHDNIPVQYPDRYNQLKTEAEANAGPKSGLVSIDVDTGKLRYGLVLQGQTDPATAHYLAGYQATITLTSPNVTFSDGTTQKTVTTPSAAASLDLAFRHNLIAGETVTASITITGVPSTCFLMYTTGTATQRVLTPLTTTVTGTGQGTETKTVWQPQVTTQIGSATVAPGTTSVTDKVEAEAVGGSQWPVQTWADAIQTQPKTYYPMVASGQIVKADSPVAPSASLPAGAQVLSGDPTLVSLSGPGVWATTDVPLPADPGSGYYALHWCLDAKYQGDNAKYLPTGGPFCDDYFSTDERFTVPMRIGVASTMPVQYQPKGTAPDDTITLSLPEAVDQWMPGADGNPVVVKVEGTYYAGSASSFTLADQPPADAAVLGTASVNVTLPTSGRAPVTVPAPAGFTVPTSQYGVWVWRIDVNNQAAATKPLVASSVSDKFGQQMETSVTQMELTIQSQTKDATITEPTGDATAQVCDIVWVNTASTDDLWLNQWGTNKPVEVTVTGQLHHSAVPAAEVTSLDTSTPVVDQYTLTFTSAGQDHAQTVCHPVSYGDYGAYGFQWSIDPSAQPAATKDYLAAGTTTPLWLPVETTMVKRTPVIHTSASQWNTTDNGQGVVYFQDDLWADDWPDGPADTDNYGAVQHGQWAGLDSWTSDVKTVTVELWRIDGTVTPDSCTASNPDATLVATNTLTPAQNTWAAAATVSGSKFKASGGQATYTFVVSSPGDARTEAFRTVCGEPSETITIVPTPPSFITQLVTTADAATATVATAQAQQTATTVQPGGSLVDVLNAWYPDNMTTPKADMTGWQATWGVYYTPTGDSTTTPNIITGAGGQKVYENATCTPDTLLTSVSEPVKVEQAGTFTSPTFTAPDKPGMIFVVETVTNNSDAKTPVTVERGVCGLVAESAVIPQPTPQPQITTQAPATAPMGDKITDQAKLVGPYSKGDQVDFWYQTGKFIDPGEAADQLVCAKPNPDDMTGATHIGTVTLDHDIAAGTVETITSPQFATSKPDCTFIKEIATRPGGDTGKATTLAQGYFGAANETTIWTTPPTTLTAETGGTVLANTGANITPWMMLSGIALLAGGTILVVYWRRRRGPAK